MSELPVDLSALRRELQALPRGELLIVAQRAIEMLPNGALPGLLGDLVQIAHSPQSTVSAPTLLDEVRIFSASSLSGKFHDGFDVNGRNFTQQSLGTDAFIAEFGRLLGRCVLAVGTLGSAMLCQAFEILFELLRHIDEGRDDVVFFADEGGSWCIGVDWRKALPAYFTCLAQTTSAKEFAGSVERVISDFVDHDRGRFIEEAGRVASAAQRACLNAVPTTTRE